MGKATIEEFEFSEDQVKQQLELFKKGTQYVKLLRAANTKDGGIRLLNREGQKEAVERFETAADSLNVTKFVPASGAATRMFKQIFQWIANPEDHRKEINAFFKQAESFAFFETWLEKANELDVETFESGLSGKVRWLEVLVQDEGLGFANLPKGVIPFHQYGETSATPVLEHLKEAKSYASSNGVARLHFTISKEFEPLFKAQVDHGIASSSWSPEDFHIDYSTQLPETDTLATDLKGEPIKKDGSYQRRPGGHGSLLHNLNELDSDLVFIKNIDNVCHDRLLDETVKNKKILGGLLLELRADLLSLHKQVGKGLVDAVSIDQVRDKWKIRIPRDYTKLLDYLKRPIRVCGMVKNEGEPGGGPFWCLDRYTGESLQIVEQSQVDRKNMRQEMILSSATHFNPVDLVCCVRDLEGNKINLLDFVDHDQFFIAQKSIDGKEIQALEWPGLWNGGMAHWITVFAEIPISTFNPVKELGDLLRKNHLPANE